MDLHSTLRASLDGATRLWRCTAAFVATNFWPVKLLERKAADCIIIPL